MILVGCQSAMNMIPCVDCKFKQFPHRCNVFRDTANMEKIYSWEWTETPESSNIEMFAYEDKMMRVCFKNGSMYDYFEVPKEIAEGMKKAESKGKYLNQYLRGKFRTAKVE